MEQDYSFLENKSTEELLTWAFKTHGERCAVGTSLQKTGIAIIDIASRIVDNFRVFFVDTLEFPKETYELLEEVEELYSINIERYTPDKKSLDSLFQAHGQHPYYASFGREYCCKVRKVDPNEKALKTIDIWISGLRASQSSHRKKNSKKFELIYRRKRPILKINPLLDWSDEDLEAYSKEHKLPYNKLYDYCSPYGERYHVLGCKCCHIPVLPGKDNRSGKFPWEGGAKECGLHVGTNMEGSGI